MEKIERVTDERMRHRGKGRRKKTSKGPETLEAILSRWLKKNQINATLGREQIDRRWEDTVGMEIAEKTRVVDLRGGTLVVEVDSAPLLGELSAYYREEIIQTLRQGDDFPNLREIRFRAASFEKNT